MQNNYLRAILHVKRKKLFILTVVTWFLILDKIQDGGQDGDHVRWRHRPPVALPPKKYTSSCRLFRRVTGRKNIIFFPNRPSKMKLWSRQDKFILLTMKVIYSIKARSQQICGKA